MPVKVAQIFLGDVQSGILIVIPDGSGQLQLLQQLVIALLGRRQHGLPVSSRGLQRFRIEVGRVVPAPDGSIIVVELSDIRRRRFGLLQHGGVLSELAVDVQAFPVGLLVIFKAGLGFLILSLVLRLPGFRILDLKHDGLVFLDGVLLFIRQLGILLILLRDFRGSLVGIPDEGADRFAVRKGVPLGRIIHPVSIAVPVELVNTLQDIFSVLESQSGAVGPSSDIQSAGQIGFNLLPDIFLPPGDLLQFSGPVLQRGQILCILIVVIHSLDAVQDGRGVGLPNLLHVFGKQSGGVGVPGILDPGKRVLDIVKGHAPGGFQIALLGRRQGILSHLDPVFQGALLLPGYFYLGFRHGCRRRWQGTLPGNLIRLLGPVECLLPFVQGLGVLVGFFLRLKLAQMLPGFLIMPDRGFIIHRFPGDDRRDHDNPVIVADSDRLLRAEGAVPVLHHRPGVDVDVARLNQSGGIVQVNPPGCGGSGGIKVYPGGGGDGCGAACGLSPAGQIGHNGSPRHIPGVIRAQRIRDQLRLLRGRCRPGRLRDIGREVGCEVDVILIILVLRAFCIDVLLDQPVAVFDLMCGVQQSGITLPHGFIHLHKGRIGAAFKQRVKILFDGLRVLFACQLLIQSGHQRFKLFVGFLGEVVGLEDSLVALLLLFRTGYHDVLVGIDPVFIKPGNAKELPLLVHRAADRVGGVIFAGIVQPPPDFLIPLVLVAHPGHAVDHVLVGIPGAAPVPGSPEGGIHGVLADVNRFVQLHRGAPGGSLPHLGNRGILLPVNLGDDLLV